MRTKVNEDYNMVSFRFHFCFLVLFVVFLTPTHSLGHICLPKQHVALFIFGDSLFDAGNNDYINTTTDNLANYGPYGETFFNYPTGRFSNGRLIPDFIGKLLLIFLFLFYFFFILRIWIVSKLIVEILLQPSLQSCHSLRHFCIPVIINILTGQTLLPLEPGLLSKLTKD